MLGKAKAVLLILDVLRGIRRALKVVSSGEKLAAEGSELQSLTRRNAVAIIGFSTANSI
jgi:hypothetical protein